jgi:hypothetical protein
VVLGWFDPDYFNGGRMKLDAGAAYRAVEKLASAIGRSVPATAFAIITIANELMIKAIHEITVSEGVNPRESVIVAGGGGRGAPPISDPKTCARRRCSAAVSLRPAPSSPVRRSSRSRPRPSSSIRR